jgi:hypothetical protein
VLELAGYDGAGFIQGQAEPDETSDEAEKRDLNVLNRAGRVTGEGLALPLSDSTDSARGGNIGLSMVMVIALGFGFLRPSPVSDRQPGVKNWPRDQRQRF